MVDGIACIGAAHVDRIARCKGAFVPGASNPVTIAAASGGVARNVALNLARLGRRAKLASVLGDDEAGDGLLTELAAAGVECRDVARLAGRVTASYTAVLDEAGELICGLADGDIYDTLDAARLEALAPGLAGWPIWALDANLPHAGIAALAACKPAGVRLAGLAVSPAKAARLDAPLAAFDMLFANRTEAAVLAERQVDTAAEAVAAAAALRARGPGLVCVTLGAEGVAVAAAEGTALHPARQTGVVNVNGAGDAFAAGVLDGIAGGSPPNDAIARGLAAAALTARSPETCSPELSAKEVENGD